MIQLDERQTTELLKTSHTTLLIEDKVYLLVISKKEEFLLIGIGKSSIATIDRCNIIYDKEALLDFALEGIK